MPLQPSSARWLGSPRELGRKATFREPGRWREALGKHKRISKDLSASPPGLNQQVRIIICRPQPLRNDLAACGIADSLTKVV